MNRESLRRLIVWLLGKLILLGAGIIIFAALLTGVMRLLLPKVPHYRTAIETVVSKAVGYPLKIGSITVGWGGLSPFIQLDNVRLLRTPNGPAVLSLKQISASLDPLASVRELRPVVGRIVVEGLTVKFIRQADGRVTLSGLPLVAKAGEGSGKGVAQAFYWLDGAHFVLSDSTLIFVNEATGTRYRLSPVTLGARIGAKGALRVAGAVQLPFSQTSRFQFAADLQDLAPDGGRHWKGLIYTQLNAAPLGLPLLRVFIHQWPGVKGVLSAKTWSYWRDGRPERTVGHFDLRHFALTGFKASNDSSLQSNAITHMNGNFRFLVRPDGWELDAADVVAGNKLQSWPSTAFSVATQDRPGRRIYGWAQYLILQNLLPLLTALPVVPEAAQAKIIAAMPRGIISNARFDLSLPNKGLPEVTAAAEFTGIGMRAVGRIPGVEGLSGSVSITPRGGAAVIHSPAFVFDAPEYFRRPPPPAALNADITWAQKADEIQFQAPTFSLNNADLGVTGRFGLLLPFTGGAPNLDLVADIDHGRVVAVPRYMPTRLLGRHLVHWLNTSLVAGKITHASVLLQGDPRRFPFRKGGGAFKAEADISGGAIDYLKRWPPLTDVTAHMSFDNATLKGAASSGQILATQIQSASVVIPNIMHPVIDIHGKALGPLADVPRFLTFTPVGVGHEKLFQSMQAKGQEEAVIHLKLPLDHGPLDHMKLSGQTRIINGGFSMPVQDVALDRINGVFDFTLHSLSAQDVKAFFRDQPVSINAATDSRHVATLTLGGYFPVRDMLPAKNTPLMNLMQGGSYVTATLSLPMTQASMDRYGIGLDISSNLRGLTIDMPAPFGKQAATARPLQLSFSLNRQGPIAFRYGSGLRALLQIAGSGACHYLASADIRYDAGAPRLNGRGISVEANLPTLDVDSWLKLSHDFSAASFKTSSPNCPGGMGGVLRRLQSVRLKTSKLVAFGTPLGAVSLQAQRQRMDWQAQIDSTPLQGQVSVPLDLQAGRPIRFDFKRLHIETAWLSGTGPSVKNLPASFDPASIPPITGHIAQFDIAGRQLENINLATAPMPDGLKLHTLQIAQPHLDVNVSGQWLQTGSGAKTSLQALIKTDDAGAALSLFKVDEAMAGGSGQISAKLSWSGAPYAFNWKSLGGNAALSLKNGRITKVRIGILGHLLGLFNLNALPAHLSQGFTSAFKTGFPYSQISGNANFGQGNIYLQNVQVTGSTARIQAHGKINMLNQSLDIDVSAIPQISSTVTIAGAIAGGPAVGAVLYLLDRVLGVGKQINKLVAVRYHVGGSWTDPKIMPAGGLAGKGVTPSHHNTPLY